MPRHLRFALVLLLSLPTVAACSHDPQPSPPPLPEQNTRVVYPAIAVPLDCADAPIAPALDADDKDWAAYKAQDHAAGQECRERLRGVKEVVSRWPVQGASEVSK